MAQERKYSNRDRFEMHARCLLVMRLCSRVYSNFEGFIVQGR